MTNFYRKIIGRNYDKNPAFLSQWYRHWEIPSGVIWNKKDVENFHLVKKLNTFDDLYSNWDDLKERFKKWVHSE